MLKLIGAVLLVAGGGGLGFGAIRRLEDHLSALRSLAEALELLERELAFSLPPMKDLLGGTARRVGKPASDFLDACAQGMDDLGGRPLSELWRLEAGNWLTALRPRELEAVWSVGAVLGRYDADGQRKVLAACQAELAEALACAADERKKQGKVYGALGVTAGIFTLILLL